MQIGNRAAEFRGPAFSVLLRLLHAVFVGGDHLFDHLAADAAGLTGRQITVVTLLEVHAHLGWCTNYILKMYVNHSRR